jgi:hypothetical protein
MYIVSGKTLQPMCTNAQGKLGNEQRMIAKYYGNLLRIEQLLLKQLRNFTMP